MKKNDDRSQLTYKDAGVDIDAGEAVNHQPEYAAATIKPGGHKAIFDGAYGMGTTIIDLAEKNLWDNL